MKKFARITSFICCLLSLILICCACASDNDDNGEDKETSRNHNEASITASAADNSTSTAETTTPPSSETASSSAGTSSSVYAQSDFEITMEPGFTEAEFATATYFYMSNNAVLMIIKEEFTTLEQLTDLSADSTVLEYGEAVRANTAVETSEIEVSEKGVTYFTYENSALGQDFFYTAALCKGSDAFWLCTFYCPLSEKANMEEEFLNWSATIKVS